MPQTPYSPRNPRSIAEQKMPGKLAGNEIERSYDPVAGVPGAPGPTPVDVAAKPRASDRGAPTAPVPARNLKGR